MREVLAMFAALDTRPAGCPLCSEPFENGELIHRRCLLEKHGGELPEGFEELIKVFDLEGENNSAPSDIHS